MKHPMQKIERAKDGVVRFVGNDIIEYLFRTGKLDLNEIATMNFSVDDQMQLAQLLSYSVSGYGDLSYVTPASLAQADSKVAHLLADEYEKRES